MYSVTQRIAKIKQPRGGYIRPRDFTAKDFGIVPPYDMHFETIHSSLVGLAVDYLTRFMLGADAKSAFQISIVGAATMCKFDKSKDHIANAYMLCERVKDLDDASIDAACKLAGYDSAFRAGPTAYRPVENIQPDKVTCENIGTMVESALEFFKTYGPVTQEHLVFPGGYTDIVSSGDGDFMTEDTIWDFKCSVKPPQTKHTLQIAMYWLMGLHSMCSADYEKVTRFGFFNPRLAKVYTLNVADVLPETLHEIEVQVIGYEEDAALF